MNEEYKCKDCKWLTGKKNIRGIECMNPVLQEKWNKAKTLWMGELRKDSARYKQGSALACKKFEAKESEHMGRYIDAKAAIARIAGQMSYEIEAETGNETDCVDLVEELLNDIPSIDIEPKRGEWIEFDTKWGRSLYYCTNCMETSEVPTAFGKPLYNFCPNCGADMRERKESE